MIQEILNEIEGEIARITANHMLKREGPIPETLGDFISGWAYLKSDILARHAEQGQGGEETDQSDETYGETPEAVTGDSGASDGKPTFFGEIKELDGILSEANAAKPEQPEAIISAKHGVKCPGCGKVSRFAAKWDEPIVGAERLEFDKAGIPIYSNDVWEYSPERLVCPECEYIFETLDFPRGWEARQDPTPRKSHVPQAMKAAAEETRTHGGILVEIQGLNYAEAKRLADMIIAGNIFRDPNIVKKVEINGEPIEGVEDVEVKAASDAVVPDMVSEPAKLMRAWRTRCPYCDKVNFEDGGKQSIKTVEGDKYINIPEDFLTCFSCGGIYEVEDRSKKLINHAEVFDSVESLQVAFEDALWQLLTKPFLASPNLRKESHAYQSAVRNVCKRILEAYEGKIELDLKP